MPKGDHTAYIGRVFIYLWAKIRPLVQQTTISWRFSSCLCTSIKSYAELAQYIRRMFNIPSGGHGATGWMPDVHHYMFNMPSAEH